MRDNFHKKEKIGIEEIVVQMFGYFVSFYFDKFNFIVLL